MQNRIDRLEGLVLSLMTNGAQSAGPAAAAAAISRSQSDSITSSSYPPKLDQEDDDMIKEEDEGDDSEVEGVTSSLGVLKVDTDKGNTLYFGDSHWHMVLADVSVLREIPTFLFSSRGGLSVLRSLIFDDYSLEAFSNNFPVKLIVLHRVVKQLYWKSAYNKLFSISCHMAKRKLLLIGSRSRK
jgi:hypothetical protein